MKAMKLTEELKAAIYEAARNVTPRDFGLAFSGGVDSSLLAKACKDLSKNATLLTVGFSSQTDIDISNQTSKALDLRLLHEATPLEELEDSLKTVLESIDFDRIVRLENCVCFYHVFRLASRHGFGTVLSANGLDELFCGYHIYRSHYGDEGAMTDLMKTLVETAKKDKKQTDKIAALFDIDYVCPFLSSGFINLAMKIPLDLKIESQDDEMRKHILREVALQIGVPRSAALRPKKAFQYSSGIHKAITKLAKKRGFTKNKAKSTGLRSGMEAYIQNLKQSTG